MATPSPYPDTLGLLIHCAEIRRDQWKAAAGGPAAMLTAFDELYEATDAECEQMASMIDNAITIARAAQLTEDKP